MPTEDRNLAEALKALLSVGDVTLIEVPMYSAGHKLRAYQLSVNSHVILDGEHAMAVRDACKIAVDDSLEVMT